MFLAALLLAAVDPALAASVVQEPAKSPLVQEIEGIGGSGSTLLSFDVDTRGRIKKCVVLESSGSSFLDEEACETLSEKAKFMPARDERGTAVEVIGRTTRIHWRISE